MIGGRWVAAGALLVGGLLVAGLLAKLFDRLLTARAGAHAGNIARKLAFYGLAIAVVIGCLRILAVDLTALLAAAGIFGIAVGFAAQASISNVISGAFLIFERSFRVGDLIRVGDVVGEVLSIDLLAVKLRSIDNTLVRIPNESLIKTNVINLTRYPIRRLDVSIGVGYGAPLAKALEVLRRTVEGHVRVLRKPDPDVFVESLGDSGINITARVWIDRNAFVESKSELLVSMKEALDAAGIEIPFPHRKLLADPELLQALRSRDP